MTILDQLSSEMVFGIWGHSIGSANISYNQINGCSTIQNGIDFSARAPLVFSEYGGENPIFMRHVLIFSKQTSVTDYGFIFINPSTFAHLVFNSQASLEAFKQWLVDYTIHFEGEFVNSQLYPTLPEKRNLTTSLIQWPEDPDEINLGEIWLWVLDNAVGRVYFEPIGLFFENPLDATAFKLLRP